jgi:Periplasmic component of the Tol biopolymer transport system
MGHKYFYKKLNLVLILSVFFFSACNVNNSEEGGIDIGIVPRPPYNNPIYHPGGKFIGFNHTPLLSINNQNKSAPVQNFNWDSSGFWLINSDGSNLRRIFPYTLQTPVWSPDGNWIAFVSGNQICKMKFTGTAFDTTTLTQLTTTGLNFSPSWSPDGEWIAYDRSLQDTSGPGGVWIMKTDGSQKRSFFGGANPVWSIDSQSLLAVIGTSSANSWTRFVHCYLSQLSNKDTLDAVTGKYNNRPNYSPDGSQIAFWSAGNIWIMDTTGGNMRKITTEGVDIDFGLPFSWAPDGVSIVFTHYSSNDWTYSNGVIWIININTGKKTQLTFNNSSN